MTIPKLSDAALLSHTTPTVLARGKEYALSGAVRQIVQRGKQLSAAVEGSQYEPYHVEITTEAGTVVRATCTCPYDWGDWCKHIVAVLVKCRAAPDQVEQRPPLEELLRPLSRDQLHSLLLTLAERMPAIIEPLEHELLRMQTSAEAEQVISSTPPRRRTPVDTSNYRRQAEKIVGTVDSLRSGMDIYYYSSNAAHQMYELITQAHTFTENGDGDNALRILQAITEPYVDRWFELDGSSGETGEIFADLGMAWAEALLMADLSPDEREDWQDKLEVWQADVEQYGIDEGFQPAIRAVRQDWDNATIPAQSTDYITQKIIEARLNVLERQGRSEEFLDLAQAASELARYAAMLVRIGRVPEAVETGLTSFTNASDALTLATILHEHGEIDAALRVAEHGLTLEKPRNHLAKWLRDTARQQGQGHLALQSAEEAFRSAPSMQNYHAVQELAGEQWVQIRPALLDYLRKSKRELYDERVDIFLHEGLIDDAIKAVKHSYTELDKVLAAAVEQRPDWVIWAGTKNAEGIINKGQSKYYDVAVKRLSLVRRAYQHAGRAEEWQHYKAQLRDTHGRKRKLMDMLRQIEK